MNPRTLLYVALGLFAMRWLARDGRNDADLVTRLRMAGAL